VDECDTMVGITLIRPLNKVKVIHFGANRFLIYDGHIRLPIGYHSVNSNFCFRTHRLSTIHSVQTTTT